MGDERRIAPAPAEEDVKVEFQPLDGPGPASSALEIEEASGERAAAAGANAGAAESGAKRAPLKQTFSKIARDAESYGIKWKPPKQFTFATPEQVKSRHRKWLKLLGRIGWAAKAVVYALIGGLACRNGVQDDGSNASPQGAFVLIGTANGGRAALVILAIALITYAAWRFWEGAVGQGYDDNFSNLKNFFKFRLSPFVSGGVYIAYMILVVEVIPRDDEERQAFANNSDWPNSWHDSTIGIVGLVLVGLAFIAATIVQLEQFFTKSFHNTIRHDFPKMPRRFWKPFRIFVLTTGHIGVLGRAGIFVFAATLFFRTIKNRTDYGRGAFGDAFAQLQSSKGGRAVLFILGFGVVVYGLFALLNCYARYFPTPPPSRKPKVKHYEGTGGEAPLPPQFLPDEETGFRPMSAAPRDPSENRFTPLSNAAAKAPPVTNGSVGVEASAAAEDAPGTQAKREVV